MGPCLDANVVAARLAGDLCVEEVRYVEDHVDVCEACRTLIRELAAPEIAEGTNDPTDHPVRLAERVGRYVLVEWLGAGGMGVVYRAYDPELDRSVALKFLRAGTHDAASGSRSLSLAPRTAENLLLEAKALARVSHPNVVRIYDAGVYGDRMFLVMELVVGQTLTAWRSAQPRAWREILAHYIAAGRGLAGAHAAGVIHRDIKPSNLLVGDDGTVRVTDFGLARTSAADDDTRSPPSGVAGTPGYMAPEQHAGVATPESDQFSFCVSLYEALYGERPYEKTGGTLRPAPRDTKVPRWVRARLLRGLDRSPAARYPSMGALLAVLERSDPARIATRWGTLGLVALVATCAGLFLVRAERAANTVCGGASRKLDGVWDAERSDVVRRAFVATGAPYAENAWRQSAATLDRYSSAWVDMHTDACEATQLRKEQTQDVLDLRIDCLGNRLRELRAVTDLFARADQGTVEKAVAMAQSLRPLDDCADAAALRAGVPAPRDPAQRARADELSSRLATSRALGQAGKYDLALEEALGVAGDARSNALSRVLPEALFVVGELELALDREDKAAIALDDSIRAADEAHDDRTRVLAWTQLVFMFGYRQAKFTEAERAATFAGAALTRLGGDPLLRAALDDSISSVTYRKGKIDDARTRANGALAVLTSALPPTDIRIAELLYHLSLIEQSLGHRDEAVDFNQRATRIWEDALGSEHPRFALALNHQAVLLAAANRPAESLASARRALGILEKGRPPVARLVAAATANVGIALDGVGRYEEAHAQLERALAIDETVFGREHPEAATVLAFKARTLRHLGRFDEAIASDTRALAIWAPNGGPAHPSRSAALAGLGESYVAMGKPKLALPLLEQAVAVAAAENHDVIDLARMRLLLARCLTNHGEEGVRRRLLASAARDVYGRNPRFAKESAEVDAWLGTSPPER